MAPGPGGRRVTAVPAEVESLVVQLHRLRCATRAQAAVLQGLLSAVTQGATTWPDLLTRTLIAAQARLDQRLDAPAAEIDHSRTLAAEIIAQARAALMASEPTPSTAIN